MREYIVAIDLGTSRTAYSWKSNNDEAPRVATPDMQRGQDISGKSPTSLLIGGSTGDDGGFEPSRVESFGRVAEERYATNNYPHGAQLFTRFKMRLHAKPDQTSYDDLLNAIEKSSSRRAEMVLEDIFALALRFIKEAALANLFVTQRVTAKDVVWVLTVPVCCSRPAKHFMRKAAIKAGLIEGGQDDKSLVLCMEPIAACLALGTRLPWRTREKYMVVDCGGGTVDISAFQVNEAAEGKLEQVGEATGGPWGATNVDKMLENFLQGFIRSVATDTGPLGMTSFLASSSMYRILQTWERAKVNLKAMDHDIWLDLSELFNQPLEVTHDAMDAARDRQNRGPQELVGGHGTSDLILKPALVHKFFKPQTDNISRAVAQELSKPEVQGLTAVVMVGGFSGSVHVRSAVEAVVQEKYPHGNVDVLIPRSPDLAIVQGASHFVRLESSRPTPPNVGLGWRQGAPGFTKITSPTSYGILSGESAGDSHPTYFDSFILKGRGYAPDYAVQQVYMVRRSQAAFTVFIVSSANPRVAEGQNRLDAIGGLGSMQKSQELTVAFPRAKKSTNKRGSFFGRRGRANEEDTASITVQFSLRGIDLHVGVALDGVLLMEEAVRFVGGNASEGL